MADTKKKTAAEEEEVDFITLEFDDGQEVECEIMGVFECNGKEYIALLPDDGTDDVYIYGYKEAGEDEFELVDIDDDAEFEAAVAEFDKIVAEEEEEEEENQFVIRNPNRYEKKEPEGSFLYDRNYVTHNALFGSMPAAPYSTETAS